MSVHGPSGIEMWLKCAKWFPRGWFGMFSWIASIHVSFHVYDQWGPSEATAYRWQCLRLPWVPGLFYSFWACQDIYLHQFVFHYVYLIRILHYPIFHQEVLQEFLQLQCRNILSGEHQLAQFSVIGCWVFDTRDDCLVRPNFGSPLVNISRIL